jgi:hypothetical protein
VATESVEAASVAAREGVDHQSARLSYSVAHGRHQVNPRGQCLFASLQEPFASTRRPQAVHGFAPPEYGANLSRPTRVTVWALRRGL